MEDRDPYEDAASEELDRIAERQIESEKAIGRFIYEFSQMEVALKSLIMRIVGLDPRYFDAIVGSIDFALSCNILLAVTRIRFGSRPDWIEGTRGLVNRALAMNQKTFSFRPPITE